jgi:hemerythrin-like domain-containing protein
MSRPTHLLRHEHRVIEQAMRALEGMCIRMRAGGHVPAEEMAKVLDFIRGFANGFHHMKEETLLFPALEQVGIRSERGALAFLRNEHELERRLLGELELAAEEYRHNSAAGARFISAALQFKDHLIGHMQHEDATLFRLAEELLDNQVKDSLIQALAAKNAEASALIQRYERLAEELEKAWAV